MNRLRRYSLKYYIWSSFRRNRVRFKKIECYWDDSRNLNYLTIPPKSNLMGHREKVKSSSRPCLDVEKQQSWRTIEMTNQSRALLCQLNRGFIDYSMLYTTTSEVGRLGHDVHIPIDTPCMIVRHDHNGTHRHSSILSILSLIIFAADMYRPVWKDMHFSVDLTWFIFPLMRYSWTIIIILLSKE